MAKPFEEVLRVVLETEGREGIVALQKALSQLGDSSGVSADKAGDLASELDKLASTSNNIRNFTLLKATLSETDTALGKAKDKLSSLRTEFALAEKPTKSLQNALAGAERQVESLTKTQNKQTADLARTTGQLQKAGVDTNKLTSEYARLQSQYGEFGRRADATADAMGGTARSSKAAAAGVSSLGDSAKSGSVSLAAIASRLTMVSGAAVGAVAALAAFSGVAFFKGAIASATTLEDALTEVRAVSGATAEEMVQLKEAAEAGGASTKFSSLEAAKGLGELARATGTASGAIAALPAALNLAQAAGIGVADAAQFITTTLTQFGLGADQASRVADVLAQAANTTTADVRGLGDALTYAAPLAKQLGLDTEQTVAIIGALADQGFRGERAGTALRNVFSEMLDPASAFGKALRDLGIDTSDFASVMNGLAASGERGQEAILKLDAAARPAILSLVNSGSTALQQLETDLRAAGGAAEATAKIMGESVAGATESIQDTFDRTRRSLVEPILEPLRNELFELANELETFAASPEFEEIKGALTELFIEGAAAAKELFHEIDFKALAADIRTFIGDANQTVTEFRENIALIASAVEMVGDAFSLVFNAVQTIVLALAAAVAKVLELMMKMMSVYTFLPRKLQELATGSSAATDELNLQIGGLGAVYDEFAERAGKNLYETVEAAKDLAGATDEAGNAASTSLGAAAEASEKLAAASKEQAAASTEGTAALASQAAAAEAAASGTTKAADQISADATRLKNAFSDLGITSQASLQRAAESAKKNFDLIREAVSSGEATAEDARRAFAAYAAAARAAVADSDESSQIRVAGELMVQEAIVNSTRALDKMGDAGEASGKRVASGAEEAASALSQTASAASGAGGSVQKTGQAVSEASKFMREGGGAAQGFSFSMGVLSEATKEALDHLGDFAGGSGSAGLRRFAEIWNELYRQRQEMVAYNAELAEAMGKYDEFASRREQLRKRFTMLNNEELDSMIQAENKIKQAREARDEKEKQRLEQQRQADMARLEQLKLADAAEKAAGPAMKDNEQTLIIDWRAPSKSVATTASAREMEDAERITSLVLPLIVQRLERSRSISLRPNPRR